MKIYFYEPPAAQTIGGLEAAIDLLAHALTEASIPVRRRATEIPRDGDAVAHFHGLWQPAQARLSRACRAPIVISPHGMLEPWAWRHKRWKKLPYFYLRERAHLRRAQALLTTSPSEARHVGAFLPAANIASLPLGLSGNAGPNYATARAQLGWAPEEIVLTFLSRLHPKKGLHLLLEALRKMPEKKLRLVVVGDGAARYVAALHAQAARDAAELPRIDWIGEIWGEARWPYLQGADLFCLPTHSENFGLAVLEACQVGTPVLTTTGTPWPELLRGQPAFIAEPTIASLRATLLRFLAQPPFREIERAALAKWTHAQFAWEKLVADYVALYAGLLRDQAA